MTTSIHIYHEFLAKIAPFDKLDSTVLDGIVHKLEPLRYRMGQAILVKENLPARIAILYDGQARLLGYPPGAIAPQTLEKLEKGAIIGATSIIRGVPCETAIASTETVCLTLKVSDFQELLGKEPEIKDYFYNQLSLIEAYELVGTELNHRGKVVEGLKEIAIASLNYATILNLPASKTELNKLDHNLLWLVSSSGTNFPIASNPKDDGNVSSTNEIRRQKQQADTKIESDKEIRLIGFSDLTLTFSKNTDTVEEIDKISITPNSWENIPLAPEKPEQLEETTSKQVKYPYIQGRGPIDATLACFQMLSQYWNMPWKKDVLKRALSSNYQRTGKISIEICGAVAELMGLKSQLVEVPAVAISKLPTPVLLPWQDSFAILYHATEKEVTSAIPEQGIVRKKPETFIETWGEEGQVLLLQHTSETPKNRFNLSCFLTAGKKHKAVLTEVFIASLFVQLLGLANPLIT
jgi:hypothetical protein